MIKKNPIQIALIAILLIVPEIFSQVYNQNYRSYVVKTWDSKHGLPQNSIQGITKSRDGYLWLGTKSGLAKFDGKIFKIYSSAITPALSNDDILSLYADDSGVLWIGSNGGGIFYLKNGKIYPFNPENGYLDKHIRKITGDHRGNVWFGTDYGLIHLKNGKTTLITTQNGLYDNVITALQMDYSGNLWIGTIQGGLAMYNDVVVRVFGPADGLTNINILSLNYDKRGYMLIGTIGGLYQLSLENFSIKFFENSNYTPIKAISKNDNGGFWLSSTLDGIIEFNNNDFSFMSFAKGLPDDEVNCLLNGGQNILWAGSGNRGLTSYTKRSINLFPLPGDASLFSVTTILNDSQNNLWIGTGKRGLYQYDSHSELKWKSTSGLEKETINTIYEDSFGHIWIGTKSSGVKKIMNKKVVDFPENAILASQNILSISEYEKAFLLVGLKNGLTLISDNKVIKNISGFEEDSPSINVIKKNSNGHILMGTNDGLYWLSSLKAKKIFPLRNEAPVKIADIMVMQKSHLLIASDGRGLLHWPQRDYRPLTKKEGLPDNHIFSIQKDEQGYLWFTCYNGIFSLHENQLKAYYDREINHVSPEMFDENDGMITRQCSSGGQPSSLLTAGKLFVPTVRGLSIVNTKAIHSSSPFINTVIEKVNHNGVEFTPKDSIITLSGSGNLEIFFAVLDFHATDRRRIKWKLSGIDQDFRFSQENNIRVIRYNNITPGDYIFSLNAANYLGKWNPKPSRMKIYISNPFYKTLPFFILILVGVSALFISGYMLINRSRKKIITDKYRTSGLSKDREKAIKEKLLKIVTDEKIYLNPDLTMSELAKRLNIHSNYLSQLVNISFSCNFSDFINGYRIEEAKKLLADQINKDRNILELMYDCGFYSKSVFNTAFKKFTGTTPSAFRKELQKDSESPD